MQGASAELAMICFLLVNKMANLTSRFYIYKYRKRIFYWYVLMKVIRMIVCAFERLGSCALQRTSRPTIKF